MRNYIITVKFTKTGIENTYNVKANSVIEASFYLKRAIKGEWIIIKAVRGTNDCMYGLKQVELVD